MTNNEKIDITKKEIEELVAKNEHETDLQTKIDLYKEELEVRRQYNTLLKKKRPMLLTFALVFCIFYGISLAICLPPYIIRGKKMDINEEKIDKLNVEIRCLENKLKSPSFSLEHSHINNDQNSNTNIEKKFSNSSVEKVLELKKLYDSKMITEQEFEMLKNNILQQ